MFMKRCPECGREYDNTMSFCLDDGAELLYGPARMDEPATAILSEPGAIATGFLAGDAPTKPQIYTTGETALFERGAEAEPQRSFGEMPERQSLSAHRAAEPHGMLGGRNRLFLSAGFAVLLLIGGFLGYRYLAADDSGQINSIAVLPFENRSGNTDTDYLSDGIAESLIFRLSQLPDLKVSPVSSVIRYKGKEFDAQKIAAELGVGAVMLGRMTQRGDSLTISVELIDAANNKILWGEQYDRKMSDLLATQREIAAAIVDKLQLKLAGNEAKGLTKKYTDNNEAYQLYLKGRFHFTKRTKEDLFKSIEIFEQAVKLDPKFALGYVGIAESWTVIPSFPYASPAECTPKAKAAAQRALELDPELPEAHTVSAMIAATYDWDWAKAEAGFKRALELDPNVSITHYRYAWTYLSPMGRHDEAIAEMKIAMEKEPLYLIQGANYAAVLMYARRFDDAVEQAKKTYDLDPNFIGGINWLGHTNAAKGNYADALAMVEKSSDSDMPLRAAAGYVYAKTGQRDKALANIEQWKEVEKKRYVQNYWIAIAYAAMGDKDGAFAELEKAYMHRDWFLQRIKVDPFMDPLRDDPRYKEMLKRLNLPE
jgi:TolB-like protein